jgi:hypothetical protein
MQELPVASLSFAFPLFFARPTNNFFSFSSPPFESDWGRGRDKLKIHYFNFPANTFVLITSFMVDTMTS